MTDSLPIAKLRRWETVLLGLVLLANVLLRLPTLTGPLDHPDWRQTENAYAAYRMWQEPVPDILHPKVPYRGAAEVHINELPLHALGVALLYKLAGGENLLLARLFTLLTFVGACWGLLRVVGRFAGRRVAWYAVAVYATVPLSFFYSRAHHYDFMVMMFAFWFLDRALDYLATDRLSSAAWAVLCASLAFLMKAPYAFYLWLPLTIWAGWEARGKALLHRLVRIGVLGVIPLALTMAYNRYRIALDAPFTESVVYPMQFTSAFLRRFFIGTVADRFDPARWHELLSRSYWLTFTPAGLIALAVAPFVRPSGMNGKAWGAVWAFACSHAAFVLFFFPMAASTHDYYSIPLITVAALGGGLVCARLAEWGAGARLPYGALPIALILLAFAGLSVRGLHRFHYFDRDWALIEAGAALREHTPPDAVVVTTYAGRTTGWSDPRLLYYARRRGWSITWSDLTPAKLDLFRGAHGTHLAVLATAAAAPEFHAGGIVPGPPTAQVALRAPDSGEPLGELILFTLPPPSSGASYGKP